MQTGIFSSDPGSPWIKRAKRPSFTKPIPSLFNVIRALVVDAPDFDGAVRDVLNHDPVPVRKIDLWISLDEFLGLFKRFAVTLTIRGGELGGRDYREV